MARNTPSAVNILAYADIVRKQSVLRQLGKVGNDIADMAFFPKDKNVEQLLDHAEKRIFEIAEQGSRQKKGFQDIKDVLTTTLEQIDFLYQKQDSITGIPTGYKDLDDLTSGLQPSDLIIIAGRPSMGKTTFSMNIAEYVAVEVKQPVAVFSMEMSAEQLVMRLLSSLSRINQQKVRTGKLEDDDWPRITTAVSQLSSVPLFIDDTPALSPTELRARARRLAREHGQLGLIVIDYVQLMQVPESRDNRTLEVSEISRSLKALAKELHVPVVALSQLNRSLEQRPDKRPKMSDLRESGCLAGDSLVLLADNQQIPIKNLEGQKDFTILGLNTETCHIEEAQVSRVFCSGIKMVFRLKTRLGRKIKATANHKFYTPSGWKRLDELNIDDDIAVPLNLINEMRLLNLNEQTKDIYWDKVISIQKIGQEKVFDLTVPTLHNFICNSIFVHNSLEQDADLVVFIYRDEVYHDDSPEKGSAEIIIAKQRNGPIGYVRLTFKGEITRFENYTEDFYQGESYE